MELYEPLSTRAHQQLPNGRVRSQRARGFPLRHHLFQRAQIRRRRRKFTQQALTAKIYEISDLGTTFSTRSYTYGSTNEFLPRRF